MEFILVAALLLFGASNSSGPSAPVEPCAQEEAVVAEIAEVVAAPVVLAKEKVHEAGLAAGFSLRRFGKLSRDIKPGYLKFVISYIKNPKTTPADIIWTVDNWHSKKIRRMMPVKIHRELTGFIVRLQDLSREELLTGITFIKTSRHSSRTLARIMASPSG